MKTKNVNLKNIYATTNYTQTINMDIQFDIFNLFTNFINNNNECDYLHIFRLYNVDGTQLIEYEQEEIVYKEHFYYTHINEPINEKVYIIVENDYITIMLAEDY